MFPLWSRRKSNKDSSEKPGDPKPTQKLVSTCQGKEFEDSLRVSTGLSSVSPRVDNSYTDVHLPGEGAIENKGHTAMIQHHEKLVTAISTDVVNVAGVLLSNKFISEEVEEKARLPSSTPKERATFLVTALRNRIKVTPECFEKLMEIFSNEISTKEIVKKLQIVDQGKH